MTAAEMREALLKEFKGRVLGNVDGVYTGITSPAYTIYNKLSTVQRRFITVVSQGNKSGFNYLTAAGGKVFERSIVTFEIKRKKLGSNRFAIDDIIVKYWLNDFESLEYTQSDLSFDELFDKMTEIMDKQKKKAIEYFNFAQKQFEHLQMECTKAGYSAYEMVHFMSEKAIRFQEVKKE